MKKLLITSVLMVASVFAANAENLKVTSPDGRLIVNLNDKGGIVTYDVTYDGQEAVKPSRLGLITNVGDFSRGLSFKTSTTRQVSDSYSIRNIKARNVEYRANELNATYTDKQNREITVTFRVSDNNIAFRYSMPQWGETASIIIKEEATSFAFPDGTTSFICPQSSPMVGWMRTKPSYEEEYKPDAPLTDKAAYGEGYTFPCLFKVGNEKLEAGNYWVLISETGVDGKYVGSHLSDYSADNGYRIAFPMPGEANGHGTTDAALALPGATPWRTITVGSDLRPIVETTISTDVVEQKYAPSIDYRPGRYTWSWLI